MKLQTLLGIVAAQIAWATDFYNAVEQAQLSTIVGIDGKKKIVCPWSSITPMKGAIYANLKLADDMRRLSPHIDIIYSYDLTAYTVGSDIRRAVYTREPEKDRAYPPESLVGGQLGKARAEYINEYYTRLLKLLPIEWEEQPFKQEVGYASNFCTFLQYVCPEESVCYILASILLLSEGVDVPIEADEEKIVLWKNRKRQEAVLEISMLQSKDESHRKETAETINFFKKYKGTEEMPTTMQEFRKGRFLESVSFLAHSHLFECLYDESDMKTMFECVHKILENLCKAAESPEEACKERRLLDEWFMPDERRQEAVDFLRLFIKTQDSIRNIEWFPYYSCESLLTQIKVPGEAPTVQTDEPIHSAVDTGIFLLIRCFAYDPKTKSCSISGFIDSKTSKSDIDGLKKIFRHEKEQINEYGNGHYMGCTAMESLFSKWSECVTSNLSCEEIVYLFTNRTHLDSGMLNFLYALAKITGKFPSVKKQLDSFIARLKNKDTRLLELFGDLLKFTSEFFTSLSVNKQLSVELDALQKETGVDGRPEIYGAIKLRYRFSDSVLEQGMAIEFAPMKFNIWVTPVAVCYPQDGIETKIRKYLQYENHGTFTGCLLAHCLEKEMYTINQHQKTKAEVSRYVMSAVDSMLADLEKEDHQALNQIFLMLHTDSVCDFLAVFNCFNACAADYALSPGIKSLLLRASSSMTAYFLQICKPTESCLYSSIFTGAMKRNMHPKIEMSDTLFTNMFIHSLYSFIVSVQNAQVYDNPKITKAIMRYFEIYAETTKTPLHTCPWLRNFFCHIHLFKCLFSAGTQENSRELAGLLLKEGEEGGLLKNKLDLLWFGLSAITPEASNELRLQLYNVITQDIPYLKSLQKTMLRPYTELGKKAILSYLSENCSVLAESGGEEKLKIVIELFK
ncbi:uncharacterized protein NEMAJ01_0028 [Nematocida major]|uniref:uncharacterized protein n=1 Tax=Nematocida major TaxID=1912982 RepID=UPI0020081F35|nr:uncharacterized protein NEMAJ01_0028 [Nematocida major]KAH9385132.1 hypothetical protein NEMAJ01_0028 [Nematocida major]